MILKIIKDLVCIQLDATGEYNGSNCPINTAGGFVDNNDYLGPVCNPDAFSWLQSDYL